MPSLPVHGNLPAKWSDGSLSSAAKKGGTNQERIKADLAAIKKALKIDA